MNTIFSDNFDRTDSASLGSPWVDRAGDMQVKSNQMYASGTSWSNDGSSVGSADYTISVNQTFDGTQSNWVMITGRSSDEATPNNCYWAYIQNETGGQDFAQILKRVSGSQSQVGSTYNYTATATQTRTWKLSMIGTSIKVYEDGVERISATDSSHTTEGKHGVRMGNGFYADTYLLEDTNTNTNVTVTVTEGTATFNLIDPTISVEASVTAEPTVLSSTFSVVDPSVSTEVNVTATPSVAEATFNLIDPVIDAITDVTITPDALDVTSSVIDPTVTGDSLASPEVNSLVMSLLDPEVIAVADVTISASVLTLTASLQAPVISFASVRDWYEQNSSNWYTKL